MMMARRMMTRMMIRRMVIVTRMLMVKRMMMMTTYSVGQPATTKASNHKANHVEHYDQGHLAIVMMVEADTFQEVCLCFGITGLISEHQVLLHLGHKAGTL